MKKRELSFEIIRVISIILIIASHYALYSRVFDNVNFLSFPFFLDNFLLAGGKFGVIMFVLITGYFNCDKEYKVKNILKIILHTFFYSTLFLIISLIVNVKIDLNELLKSLMPISFSHYWYTTCYVMLYLLIPFINKAIYNLTSKEHFLLIIILSIFINIIPLFTLSSIQTNNLVCLIYIYIIGAYIKLHFKVEQDKRKKYILWSILSYIIAFLLTNSLMILPQHFDCFSNKIYHFYSLNSIFMYISAFYLFLYLKDVKVSSKFTKTVLFFSTTSFGVYLIHENCFVRSFLWNDIISRFSFDSITVLVGYSIICILIVLIVFSFIDYLYQKLIEKRIIKLINKIYDYISIRLSNKLEKRSL